MKDDKTSTEMQESEKTLESSATWGGVRAVTETVAFRVIGVVEDGKNQPIPLWRPCPLTAEEEALLRRVIWLN